MKYCNGCEYLDPQEEDQTDKKENHICGFYFLIIHHKGEHPLLPVPKSIGVICKEYKRKIPEDLMPIKTHTLKGDHDVFQETWDDIKSFEIRFDDRNFKVGEEIVIKETVSTGFQMKNGAPLIYTGRAIRMVIMSKLSGAYGLKPGWCVMSVSELHRVGDTDV